VIAREDARRERVETAKLMEQLQQARESGDAEWSLRWMMGLGLAGFGDRATGLQIVESAAADSLADDEDMHRMAQETWDDYEPNSPLEGYDPFAEADNSPRSSVWSTPYEPGQYVVANGHCLDGHTWVDGQEREAESEDGTDTRDFHCHHD
jgi:hypothetical protein